MRQFPIFLLLMALISSCQNPVEVDHVLRNGIIIDGSGGKPYLADLGIRGDTIAFICKIRTKTDTHSGASRTPVPGESGQLFRMKADSKSGAKRTLFLGTLATKPRLKFYG